MRPVVLVPRPRPQVGRTAPWGSGSWRTAGSPRFARPPACWAAGRLCCSGTTCCHQQEPAGRTGWSAGHRQGCLVSGGGLVRRRRPGRWSGRPGGIRQRGPKVAPQAARPAPLAAAARARRPFAGTCGSAARRPRRRGRQRQRRRGQLRGLRRAVRPVPGPGGRVQPAAQWWSAACRRRVLPSSRRRKACPIRCSASQRCHQNACCAPAAFATQRVPRPGSAHLRRYRGYLLRGHPGRRLAAGRGGPRSRGFQHRGGRTARHDQLHERSGGHPGSGRDPGRPN